MKNNLISAIAGWKSAAFLALIAMVAAVAFSGVLTTQTADAEHTNGVHAVPGQTVTVAFADINEDRFRIDKDSEGSATFAFNGATSLRCENNQAGCDVNDDSDGTGISVRVSVDEDSPIGEIYVQQITRSPTGVVGVEAEMIIVVDRPNPAVALKAYGTPPPAAKTANPTAAEITDESAFVTISAQLVNARGKGIVGTGTILVTTTRGILNSDHNGANPACTDVSACTLTTQPAVVDDTNTADVDESLAAGRVTVTLRGNGSTGTAEVVFRELNSGLTHEASVVLHGPADSISAAADQGTIGVGGSTFIVVTILDADGNPAVGAQAGVQTNNPLNPSAITGPEVPAGSSANLVTTSDTVDRNYPGVANDIPACLDDTSEDSDTTEDVDEGASNTGAGAGSNTAGKCVIQVTAPDEAGKASDATRGTHTITIGTANARIPTVTVEVQVGGVPASIESDAPARVDSLSSTKITVTVLDDEGVRVGAVPISVVQIEGNGNQDDPPGGMTSDGRGSFTFLAPLSEGEAVFLIRAGNAAAGQQIQTSLTLAIGAEPEEAPDAPPATWSKDLVAGNNLVVWNGDNDADPADGAAEGVVSIWSLTAAGWEGYFPTAADVPGGNNLDSLTNGEAYFVVVE